MNLSHRRKKRPTNKGLEPSSPSLRQGARAVGRGRRRGRPRRLPFLSLPINHPDFSSARLSYEIVRTRDPPRSRKSETSWNFLSVGTPSIRGLIHG